jgi:hypothetical protein
MSRETEVAIAVELSKALRHLVADSSEPVPSSWRGDRLHPLFERSDARSDLLEIVRSYGDELEDDEVLARLRSWNEWQKSRSRLSATLCFYHREFLHMMVEAQARFIIIGGQARRHHFGTPTRNLDLWAEDGAALQSVLERWAERFPQYSDEMKLLPRPRLRVWFPDDVCVRTVGTEDPESGIDILTRIDNLDLSQYLARAAEAKIDDITVSVLAAGDIERVSRASKWNNVSAGL